MHKCALITGATSGIGAAIAHLLASKGIELILSGRNEAELAALKKELSSKVMVTTIVCDLANQRDPLLTCETPDLVINNAGFGIYGPATDHSTASQLEVLEVNGAAALEITLEYAKRWKKEGLSGTILNVSSVAGYLSFPNFAVYAASKSFVTSFSEALDYELSKHGIRVLVSCPGQVSTNFARRAANNPKLPSKKGVMTPEYVANRIWKQIEQGKGVDVLNWMVRIAKFLCQYIVPKRLLHRLVSRSIAKRTS